MYCRPRFGLKCYQSDHYGSPEGSMGPIGGIGGGYPPQGGGLIAFQANLANLEAFSSVLA